MEQSNILNREQQLLDLGFEKNEDQRCYTQYEYGQTWRFDFWSIEELNDRRWDIQIENYKFFLKESKKGLKSDEKYLLGVESAKKEIEQKVKDLYNKYCSLLKEEQQPKLTKTINKERVLTLSSKIDVLGELKNKL